jgi:sulfatase maturation enzyme AslB (radical SAM superfamily)
LDCDGVIELGDLHQTPLKNILQTQRAMKMLEGFKQGKAVEALCQKCSYKNRFNEK